MKTPPKPPIEPGEWQTETTPYGVKRYRMIGGIREYEPELNGIPESVFFASQKKQKERDKERYAEEQRKAKERALQRRNCPFRDSIQTECTREACAMFINGCALSRSTPAKDTEGLKCPFSKYYGKCRTDCALYRGGCTLTGIIEREDK